MINPAPETKKAQSLLKQKKTSPRRTIAKDQSCSHTNDDTRLDAEKIQVRKIHQTLTIQKNY